MTRNRSCFLLIAACIGSLLGGMPASAADLSMPAVSVAAVSSATGAGGRNAVARAKADRRNKARLEKQQRAERTHPHRIVTYNLFGDPTFKLPGAVQDKRQFAPLAAGPQAGYLLSPPAASPPGELPARERADDNAGIAFDCREKPGHAGAVPRQLTACYRTQLDKGWKTQTYLSKGFATSKSEWGGGVSVIYAH